jgi:hypothetical protein
MPLSTPAARELLHTRRIRCQGFRRTDGLWDIEGHMTDVKSYAFQNSFRGEINPGEPLHDMWLRLTVDDDLVIRDVEAVTDGSPYRMCPEITPAFTALKGLCIKAGFLGQARGLLGGVKGCTHLVELLGPMATTAFQTIFAVRHRKDQEADRRPALLDTCHALASDSEVVKVIWPKHYTGA